MKTGSSQGDPLSSILFLGATEPFNRVLATAFLQLMYTLTKGVTVGLLLYADDKLTPLAIEQAEQLQPVLSFQPMRNIMGLEA